MMKLFTIKKLTALCSCLMLTLAISVPSISHAGWENSKGKHTGFEKGKHKGHTESNGKHKGHDNERNPWSSQGSEPAQILTVTVNDFAGAGAAGEHSVSSDTTVDAFIADITGGVEGLSLQDCIGFMGNTMGCEGDEEPLPLRGDATMEEAGVTDGEELWLLMY